MAISKRLRFEILKRDGFACKYCHVSEALLTVDHVVPRSLGGTDSPSNLVACCDDCNTGKSSSLPGGSTVPEPSDDVVRWTRAMKRAAHLARENREDLNHYRAAFRTEWDRWHHGPERQPVPLPVDWGHLVDQVHAAGLPGWTWREIVESSMVGNVHGDRFKHACALAWKKVSALQYAARVDASGEHLAGDLERRTHNAVITAAAYVWQSAYCAAHGEDPDPDLAAAFRARARALFPEEISAEDLMRAADASGEHAIDDLEEALDYVRGEAEDSWDEDRYLATWIEQWRETSADSNGPDEEAQAQFRDQAGAAVWAGYDGVVIGEAAHRAGGAHSPRIADYLKSAHDVLREWSERRERTAALAREATALWLEAFEQATGGDRPVQAEIEKFTTHVTGTINWYWDAEEYVLQGAQQAGSECGYTIDRYLPKDAEVPF